MSQKYRKAKMVACWLAIFLLVSLWLYLISNLKQFELLFMIVGCIFASLLVVYATVMLGIIAIEQAKPLNILWRDKMVGRQETDECVNG
jgi:hypothetical protein